MGDIPGDAVTASGSGLDPHITVANARLQAARVAGARGLSEKILQEMITDYTIDSLFQFSGEPYVNVLELNLALDINK
jgi:K+-transporting ATPase ATPase C chain